MDDQFYHKPERKVDRQALAEKRQTAWEYYTAKQRHSKTVLGMCYYFLLKHYKRATVSELDKLFLHS